MEVAIVFSFLSEKNSFSIRKKGWTWFCPLWIDWMVVVCYWSISCDWQVAPPSRQ